MMMAAFSVLLYNNRTPTWAGIARNQLSRQVQGLATGPKCQEWQWLAWVMRCSLK